MVMFSQPRFAFGPEVARTLRNPETSDRLPVPRWLLSYMTCLGGSTSLTSFQRYEHQRWWFTANKIGLCLSVWEESWRQGYLMRGWCHSKGAYIFLT